MVVILCQFSKLRVFSQLTAVNANWVLSRMVACIIQIWRVNKGDRPYSIQGLTALRPHWGCLSALILMQQHTAIAQLSLGVCGWVDVHTRNTSSVRNVEKRKRILFSAKRNLMAWWHQDAAKDSFIWSARSWASHTRHIAAGTRMRLISPKWPTTKIEFSRYLLFWHPVLESITQHLY